MITRLHLYFGLLSFSHFLVYGIAGLTAAIQTQRERPKLAVSTRTVPFVAGPSQTDKQVADAVYQALNLTFSRPMPDWFLKRTPDHHLLLDFYHINGIHRVTVVENEAKVRIEEIRSSPWLFLEDMHAMTGEDGEHFRLIRLWSWYNQFATWTLIGMTLSGLLIWLQTRLRPFRLVRTSHLVTSLITAPFLLIFGISALQMTHRGWFPLQPAKSQIELTEPAGQENARTLAATLMSRDLIRGEIDFAQSTPASIKLRTTQPAANFDVSYIRATGQTTIKVATLGPMAILNRLHHTAGLWHDTWPNQIWNGILVFVSLGLIGLGGTGLWLWFERRRDRAFGFVLLAVSVGFSLTVLTLIRYP